MKGQAPLRRAWHVDEGDAQVPQRVDDGVLTRPRRRNEDPRAPDAGQRGSSSMVRRRVGNSCIIQSRPTPAQARS